MTLRKLELLAPAKNRDVAIAAINAGADAVYIGGPDHGARAAASNSVDDIRTLCKYAHRFRAKVYVTFNTLIYDNELGEARRTVIRLYEAGVDALIVQDLGLLRLDLPPIALHASTQCDTRTPAKARFLEDIGMSCIVLPREMTLDEIRRVAAVTSVPLEGFVHGALCVCYSGDCRASLVNGGRSANRGECAQICRLPYDLTDGNGNVIVANRHFLSLKDMNRLAYVADLAEAGITSFKIEGRLKSEDYVVNAVAAYSRALDLLCEAQPERYCRASAGKSDPGFTPDLNKAFNRGFTEYFLTGKTPEPSSLSQPLSPKFIGTQIGIVTQSSPKRLTARLTTELHNGDGLGFFDKSGTFVGFRLNRVDGNVLYPASPVTVSPGTKLYRNSDKAFDDTLKNARPKRVLTVNMALAAYPGGLSLTIDDERGCHVVSTMECDLRPARSSQEESRRRILERLGDTIYVPGKISDSVGDLFIPASRLTSLRRQTLETLDHAAEATRPIELRRNEKKETSFPVSHLTFHDNVANRASRRFYKEHGVTSVMPAMEIDLPGADEDTHVMTTRFCLRREMGACLKSSGAGRLPSPLFLRPVNPAIRTMRLDFDCVRCRMRVIACKRGDNPSLSASPRG